MKSLKPIRSSNKRDRERQVLLGLVDYYVKTGKPVGSNTLKDVGFEDLSSATIRNYFAHLESENFLLQQHSSGGRIPTSKAFRLYAQEYIDESHTAASNNNSTIESLHFDETREVTKFLQQAAESLSSVTHTSVFLSAPRFEQDFITEFKLFPIDTTRCLCVLITDFGEIVSEILHVPQKISSFSYKRIETYFNSRLSGQYPVESLNETEEEIAKILYNEVIVRYVVRYSSFTKESEIYRTGFSRLLIYPEFQDPAILGNSLALFENTHGMHLLLRDCCKSNAMKFWIGEDLLPFSPQDSTSCSVISMPYLVNTQPVGAVGLLGPMRMPYRQLFKLLRDFTHNISESLTKNLYKFKITMRPNQKENTALEHNIKLISQSQQMLLEHKGPSKPARRK